MSKWCIHKKWDAKFGIPDDISEYVLHCIDSKGPKDKLIKIPEDFLKHTLEPKIIIAGHQPVSCATFLRNNWHDRGKSKKGINPVYDEDIKFLSNKGSSYVRAYLMHIVIDYLNDLQFWREGSGESVLDCLSKYIKKKANQIHEAGILLTDTINFLENHVVELSSDLASQDS